jgi:hypothetical protein
VKRQGEVEPLGLRVTLTKPIPHDLHVVSSRNVTPRHRHRRWMWILVLILLGSAVAIRLLISNAESILRSRVVDTLATRFNSRVELAGFHVWFEHGLHASGGGLRVYRKGSVAGQVGAYPLIGIEIISIPLGRGCWDLRCGSIPCT